MGKEDYYRESNDDFIHYKKKEYFDAYQLAELDKLMLDCKLRISFSFIQFEKAIDCFVDFLTSEVANNLCPIIYFKHTQKEIAMDFLKRSNSIHFYVHKKPNYEKLRYDLKLSDYELDLVSRNQSLYPESVFRLIWGGQVTIYMFKDVVREVNLDEYANLIWEIKETANRNNIRNGIVPKTDAVFKRFAPMVSFRKDTDEQGKYIPGNTNKRLKNLCIKLDSETHPTFCLLIHRLNLIAQRNCLHNWRKPYNNIIKN